MPSQYDIYTSPLASRNASKQMLELWSPRHKFNTWRRIWLAIAEAQHEVTKDWGTSQAGHSGEGAPSVSAGPDEHRSPNPPVAHAQGSSGPLVTKEQVEELRAVVERVNADGSVGITDEELDRAKELEAELRHDVMAHVHCLGEQCPKAKPIIHLGCTSQDVVCNADILTWSASLLTVQLKLAKVLDALGHVAGLHKSVPTLGFTHYQTAQPTTIGKRCAGWAWDLFITLERIEQTWCSLPFDGLRGLKGATGTQASFLKLLEDQHARVDHLELTFFAKLYGYETPDEMEDVSHPFTGQTYPRVIDTFILADLASIASVLHKIATDIRLLSNRKEIDEPFGAKQIGSSAMPYKRNPMRCERICGLTRFVMNLVGNAYDTAATQWLERTLDDSSNRRLSLPEAFLALDGALDLMHNVASGLIVHEAMVKKNLEAELPFIATENILMEAVKAGGDRQDLHERIRVHAQEAGHRFKHLGLDNDLIERIKADPAFASIADRLTPDDLLDPLSYTGRAVEQTERFLSEVIEPLREQYSDELNELESTEPKV